MNENKLSNKKVLVIRSFHVYGDSRLRKIVEDYKNQSVNVEIIYWSRGQNTQDITNSVKFEGYGGIGSRYKNIIYFLRWYIFMCYYLIKNRKKYDFIHSVDFDTAIISYPTSKLLGKILVFDSFDHFSSSREIKGLLAYIFDFLERRIALGSSITVLPDKSRFAQYKIRYKQSMAGNFSIIPNAPKFTSNALCHNFYKGGSNKLILSYVGTLERKHRGLEFLPSLCINNPTLIVNIAGNGELESFFDFQSKKIDNLIFHGYVPYEIGLKIMSESHFIYGPYLLSSPNHKYASPNKMYEHLYLGRPLITNFGTPVESFIVENNSGFLFDGTEKGLNEIIKEINIGMCEEFGLNAHSAWINKYGQMREHAVKSFFENLNEKF